MTDTKERSQEFVEHHGVKGMRWGVRKIERKASDTVWGPKRLDKVISDAINKAGKSKLTKEIVESPQRNIPYGKIAAGALVVGGTVFVVNRYKQHREMKMYELYEQNQRRGENFVNGALDD